jgi:hypothetical protein
MLAPAGSDVFLESRLEEEICIHQMREVRGESRCFENPWLWSFATNTHAKAFCDQNACASSFGSNTHTRGGQRWIGTKILLDTF